MAKVAYLE